MIHQKYIKIPGEFIPQDYGAKGDCKRQSGCVFGTVQTDIIISPAAVFSPSDVGKVMIAEFAGAGGNDLVSPITEFIDAFQVRLADHATTGHTTHQKLIYWGTDDTDACQRCIIAAVVHGAAVVRLIGQYMIAGPVITVLGGITYNAQLYIPWMSFTDVRPTIAIDGVVKPNSTDSSPNPAAKPSMNFNGFVSAATTDIVGAAVLGTGYGPGVQFNQVLVTYEKFKILVMTNGMGDGAGIGGINMEWNGTTIVKDVLVNIQNSLPYSVRPATPHVGIRLNNVKSEHGNYLHNSQASGFEYGIWLCAEHTTFSNLASNGNYYGFVFQAGAFMISGQLIMTHWCTRQIFIKTYVQPGETAAYETATVNIAGTEIETIGMPDHPITFETSWLIPEEDGLLDIEPSYVLSGTLVQAKPNGQIVIGPTTGSTPIDVPTGLTGFKFTPTSAMP